MGKFQEVINLCSRGIRPIVIELAMLWSRHTRSFCYLCPNRTCCAFELISDAITFFSRKISRELIEQKCQLVSFLPHKQLSKTMQKLPVFHVYVCTPFIFGLQLWFL